MADGLTPEQHKHALRGYYRDVFASPMGRKVLEDLKRVCRVNKPTHVHADDSGRATANLEGKRAVALYIIAMAAETEDLLQQLLDAQESP